jgi:hypothetical protein
MKVAHLPDANHVLALAWALFLAWLSSCKRALMPGRVIARLSSCLIFVAMPQVQHYLPSKLAQGLPANLADLDKKYAREISQPMVSGIGKPTKSVFKLLFRAYRQPNWPAKTATTGGLAARARRLVHKVGAKLFLETILPGGARAASRSARARRSRPGLG